MQRIAEISSKHPWTENPLTAYQQFLSYAGGEVNQSVLYNQNMLSMFPLFLGKPATEPKLEVTAYDGEFCPLTTALSSPIYCSKITIRNIAAASFHFSFKDTIISGIIGIEATEKCSKSLNIAYRNIVPSEFSQARQLAGPMGFHEYLIDGAEYAGRSRIDFYLKSIFQLSPIKIVFQNCKGSCLVTGLSESEVALRFQNECSEEFAFMSIGPKEKEEKKAEKQEERKDSPRPGK